MLYVVSVTYVCGGRLIQVFESGYLYLPLSLQFMHWLVVTSATKSIPQSSRFEKQCRSSPTVGSGMYSKK